MKQFEIPKEVTEIISVLMKIGYKAYIVGGCVRDLLMGREPKDWDIATDATPDEVIKIFSGRTIILPVAGAVSDVFGPGPMRIVTETIYENKFGTVGIKTGSQDPTLAVVEVTTFRKEEKYSDLRHPDKIEFTSSIEEDLARRDFTINAIALDISNQTLGIKDPFDGQRDLGKKNIQTVGEPEKRFNEDALRLMRAVRFASELGFEIEGNTALAIKESAKLLAVIAKERIRDEFTKIILALGKGPYNGLLQLEELGLLEYIIPELREGIGIGQNKHHIYTVWEHNLLALDYAASKNYSLEVRLASLLHDVGKPRTKEGDGPNSIFYNHEVVGAKMTKEILSRLHFPKSVIEKVTHLVRTHLFYYNVGEVTAAGVRRFLARVGEENVEDLLKVREADRIGSGVPKAFPYKLRHLKFMIEKVKADPISPKMLAVKGDEVVKILNTYPGPRIGWILGILLEEVLDEPARNEREYLVSRIKNLGELSDDELRKVAEGAKKRKEEFESGMEAAMKKKYYVK